MPRSKKFLYKKFESGCPVKKERTEESNSIVNQSEVSSVSAVGTDCASNTSFVDVDEKGCFSDMKARTFHLIHVNWFCVTNNNIYYPAEVALVEFSLESGIKSTYHTLINSGPTPCGFAYEVKAHVEETHGIPTELGEEDYRKILRIIRKFLNEDENSNKLSPVYTMPDLSSHNFSLTAVKSTLLTLCDVAGCPEEYDNFEVLSLSKLFFDMKNKCSMELDGVNTFQKLLNAEIELQKDTYTYSQWIDCLFHHENGKSEYCSLALVHRWAYIICDNLCPDLHIPMLEGKHKPMQTITRTFYNTYKWKLGKPQNDSRKKQRTTKYNRGAELENNLPETLCQLTITEDPSDTKTGDSSSPKAETPKDCQNRNYNRSEQRKKTAADVVSGTEHYPQFSEWSFPAIGSGKKYSKHSKW